MNSKQPIGLKDKIKFLEKIAQGDCLCVENGIDYCKSCTASKSFKYNN